MGYDGFEKSKNFITNVAEYFNQDTTRVGVIEFNSEARTIASLTENRDAAKIKSIVSGIEYKTGAGHSIIKAYEAALTQLNSQQLQGGKFVILITASEHGDNAKHSAAAISKSAMEGQGIRFIVVGAGDKVNRDRLIEYSSGSNYVYKAEDFDDLVGFITRIRDSICRRARFF